MQAKKDQKWTFLSIDDKKISYFDILIAIIQVDRHIRRLEMELKKFAAELDSSCPGVTSSLVRSKLLI